MGRTRYLTIVVKQAQTQWVKLSVSELPPSDFDDAEGAAADRVEGKSVSDKDR